MRACCHSSEPEKPPELGASEACNNNTFANVVEQSSRGSHRYALFTNDMGFTRWRLGDRDGERKRVRMKDNCCTAELCRTADLSQ